jgi:ribosomal protein S27E
MPIYTLECPDCRHAFQGMAIHGQPAQVWVCSQCGSDRAAPKSGCEPTPHPWETKEGGSCPCCGL